MPRLSNGWLVGTVVVLSLASLILAIVMATHGTHQGSSPTSPVASGVLRIDVIVGGSSSGGGREILFPPAGAKICMATLIGGGGGGAAGMPLDSTGIQVGGAGGGSGEVVVYTISISNATKDSIVGPQVEALLGTGGLGGQNFQPPMDGGGGTGETIVSNPGNPGKDTELKLINFGIPVSKVFARGGRGGDGVVKTPFFATFKYRSMGGVGAVGGDGGSIFIPPSVLTAFELSGGKGNFTNGKTGTPFRTRPPSSIGGNGGGIVGYGRGGDGGDSSTSGFGLGSSGSPGEPGRITLVWMM